MVDGLATVLTYASLGLALWALILVVINRPFDLRKPYGLALAGGVLLLELALLAQTVTGIVNLINDDPPIARITFVGYLIGPVLILPLAAGWSLTERTRWGPAILIVGCLTIPILILRLRQIWDGHG
ncbi:MAG: hypothetical protein ABW224_19695 [Kibdelosporangium sp.]